jgi:anti-sigma B factor antagonist
VNVLSTPVPVFQLEVHPERSDVVVELAGEIDCVTAPRIAEAIDDLVRVGWDAIVVDLRAVSFVDSTGLRLFLAQDARARREQWRFELRGPCPSLERLLSVTGLEGWFTRRP